MNKINVIVIDFIPQENWGFKEKPTASSLEKWNVLSFKTNTLHGSKLSSLNVLKKTQYHLIIACDTYHPTSKVKNIEVLNDCHGKQMLELMAKCHCVVCPLKDLKTSSGQLVVLQAMAFGKPVICTKADGIKDYVEDGMTGLLIENEKEAWIEALDKIYNDTTYYDEICYNARISYLKNFTENAMYKRIAKIVNKN